MKAEYRIKEKDRKFTIETKLEIVRYTGFFGQTKKTDIEWRRITTDGGPLFRIRLANRVIDNYDMELKPFETLEEAIRKIKKLKEDPVYYDEKGMPEEVKIPPGNVPRIRNPPPPPPPVRRIGTHYPEIDNTNKPPKKK